MARMLMNRGSKKGHLSPSSSPSSTTTPASMTPGGGGSHHQSHHEQLVQQQQLQKKPFLFGLILGATIAYSLASLAESIRLSHDVHHYVHHEVPDFNILNIDSLDRFGIRKHRNIGGEVGGVGEISDDELMANLEHAKVEVDENEPVVHTNKKLRLIGPGAGLSIRQIKKQQQQQQQVGGNDNGNNKDKNADIQYINLDDKEAKADALRAKYHYEMERQKEKEMEMLDERHDKQAAARKMRYQLLKTKRKKKEVSFDERMNQNKDKQVPVFEDAHHLEVSWRLDAPITDEMLQQLGLGDGDICDPVTNTLKIKKRMKLCLQGQFPQYQHPLPLFVDGTNDKELFMIQPENQVALEANWVNWSWQTCINLVPGASKINSLMTGSGIESFQHFHDNGIGQIYQMRYAYDFLQKILVSKSNCQPFPEELVTKRPGNVILMEEWKLMGFPYKEDKKDKGKDTAGSIIGGNTLRRIVGDKTLRKKIDPNQVSMEVTFYPQDFDQVRIHPVHVEWLRSKFPFPPQPQIDRNKIVFISRQGSNKGALGRQFQSEKQTLKHIKQRIPSLVYFHPGKEKINSVDGLVDYLGDACLIMGLHGGHMYNQFFTSTETNVLELVAVDERGLFHSQKTERTRPVLSHRAMWQNSNLIKQPYWRVHFPSPFGTKFVFEQETYDNIFHVVEKAGCNILPSIPSNNDESNEVAIQR